MAIHHSSDQWCFPGEGLNPFRRNIAFNTIDGNDGLGTKVQIIQFKHEETEWIDRHPLALINIALD